MNSVKTISTVVAPIHRKPSFTSEMVSQALMWEDVVILEQKNNWIYVNMEDSYSGWINQIYLAEKIIHSYKNIWLKLPKSQ